MHILILENGINIDNLVLALKQNEQVGLIFASQDAICTIDEVTKLDIESDEIEELVDFATANAIDFVFVLSSKAQSTEIIELFKLNGIGVFGSSQGQYEYLLSRANTKKLIYKNKIPTLKFATFEKLNVALDWCKNAQYPILIMSDMKDELTQKTYADTCFKAQSVIENLFEQGYEKIVVEQAVEGHYFSSYFLTDSASHVHLADFLKESELTICPDFQINSQIQDLIYRDYYLRFLDAINYNFEPFCGVLKLDFLLADNNLYLLDAGANFNTVDFQMLLNILDTDVCALFTSLSTGALEDFEGCMLLNDNYLAGLHTSEHHPYFEEDDNVELIEMKHNDYLYLAQASTVSRACGYLDELKSQI